MVGMFIIFASVRFGMISSVLHLRVQDYPLSRLRIVDNRCEHASDALETQRC